MNNPYRSIPLFYRAIGVASLFILSVLSPEYSLASSVKALLRQGHDSQIIFQVTLNAPAPPTFIAQLYLTPGTVVTSTTPPAAKISPRSGAVKWLIKGAQPGDIRLIVETGRPIQLKKTTGMIRFRQPGSGQMLEIKADYFDQ